MLISELKTWALRSDTEYLKMYLGLNTIQAVERFQVSFIKFLNLYTGEFESLSSALKMFVQYRREIKLKRAA